MNIKKTLGSTYEKLPRLVRTNNKFLFPCVLRLGQNVLSWRLTFWTYVCTRNKILTKSCWYKPNESKLGGFFFSAQWLREWQDFTFPFSMSFNIDLFPILSCDSCLSANFSLQVNSQKRIFLQLGNSDSSLFVPPTSFLSSSLHFAITTAFLPTPPPSPTSIT